jgi:hypothetical protein
MEEAMPAEDLFHEILELNRRAVTSDSFEVAYHLLAAALHAAEGDVDRIDAVIALAREQAEAVDGRPNHALSSDRAAQRGTTPLYRSLVSTAEAKRAQVKAEIVREHHQ